MDSMSDAQLTVVCAWCSETVSGDPDHSPGPTSHGICASCARSFMKRLPPAYLASIADPEGNVTLFSGHAFKVSRAASD
jgi:hypothetical protein